MIEQGAQKQLVNAIKAEYDTMRELREDIGNPDEVEKRIGPILNEVSDDDRWTLGGLIWQEWQDARDTEHPSPYAGLAYHLAPPVGGS